METEFDDGGLRRYQTIYDQSEQWDDSKIAICMGSGSPEALDEIVRMTIRHLNKLASRVMSTWADGPYKRQRIDDLVDAALGDLGQRLGRLVKSTTSPAHLLNSIRKRARDQMWKELAEQSESIRVPQSTIRRRLRDGRSSPVHQRPLPDDYEIPNRYGDVPAEILWGQYRDAVGVLVDAAKVKSDKTRFDSIRQAVDWILDGGSVTGAAKLAVSGLPWGKGRKAGLAALRDIGRAIENDASLDWAREIVFWCWGANQDELTA